MKRGKHWRSHERNVGRQQRKLARMLEPKISCKSCNELKPTSLFLIASWGDLIHPSAYCLPCRERKGLPLYSSEQILENNSLQKLNEEVMYISLKEIVEEQKKLDEQKEWLKIIVEDEGWDDAVELKVEIQPKQ